MRKVTCSVLQVGIGVAEGFASRKKGSSKLGGHLQAHLRAHPAPQLCQAPMMHWGCSHLEKSDRRKKLHKISRQMLTIIFERYTAQSRVTLNAEPPKF